MAATPQVMPVQPTNIMQVLLGNLNQIEALKQSATLYFHTLLLPVPKVIPPIEALKPYEEFVLVYISRFIHPLGCP